MLQDTSNFQEVIHDKGIAFRNLRLMERTRIRVTNLRDEEWEHILLKPAYRELDRDSFSRHSTCPIPYG